MVDCKQDGLPKEAFFEMKNLYVTPTMAKALGTPFLNSDGRVLKEVLK
jgi:hypothetical protein